MSRTFRKSIYEHEARKFFSEISWMFNNEKDLIKRVKLSFTDKAYRNTPPKKFKKEFTRSFRRKSKSALHKCITYGKEEFPVEKKTVEYDWY